MHTCINLIPQKISPKWERIYNNYFTLLELMEELMVMANDESPKLNGFLFFFFKVAWDCIMPYMFRVYKGVVWEKSLGTLVNKGFIKFIPKTRDLESITSWQPITLLNVSYNILAKAMVLWHQHILSHVFSEKKVGFIWGWFTLDNVICNMGWYGMG